MLRSFSLGSSSKLLVLCSWLTLGFSDTLLLLHSWLSPGTVRHALDAALLTPTCSWCYALSCLIGTSNTLLVFFYPLNYLAGCSALSLCLVLGHASTLLTLRSWFLLEHGTLFLLLFVTLNTSTLLMLRSWLRLWHSLDATRWTLSWNSSRCCWRYGPPQSWWYALITCWNFQRALVGATLRLLTPVWRKSRSWCYALSFVLEHARAL